MSELATRDDRQYTWRDYQSWPDGERWEILDGVAYAMSPSPSLEHQSVSRELLFSLTDYLHGKPCEVFGAPTDVRLSDVDVVQPDIVVVCDDDQLKRTHVDGPPTLVVEVVSPSSEVRDRHDKMALYAKHGVREYWIVTPSSALVEVYILQEAGYRVESVYKKGETLQSPQLPGLAIDLSTVFSSFNARGEHQENADRRS
jgi:Uma2 family endonuclease